MIRGDIHSMARLGGFDGILGSKPTDEIDAALYSSDEKDRLPLKLRLKTLLASKRLFGQSAVSAGVFENASDDCPSRPAGDVIVKKEDGICDFQDHLCFHLVNIAMKGRDPGVSQNQGRSDMGLGRIISKRPCCRIPETSDSNVTQADSYINSDVMSAKAVFGMDAVLTNSGASPQHSVPPNISDEVIIDHRDGSLAGSLGDGIIGFAGSDTEAVKIKNEVTDYFVDELDHVSLRVRQRMLRSRKLLGVKKPTLEGDSEQLSSHVIGLGGDAGMNSGEGHSTRGKSPEVGIPFSSICEERASDLYGIAVSGSSNGTVSGSSCVFQQCTPVVGICHGAESTKSINYCGDRECGSMCSSGNVNPCDRQCVMPADQFHASGYALPRLAKVKDEPLDWNELPNSDKSGLVDSRHLMGAYKGNGICTSDKRTNPVNSCSKRDLVSAGLSVPVVSPLSNSVHVKDDPVVNNEFNAIGNNSLAKSLSDLFSLKRELQTSDESLEDFLDHMPLQDRLKLPMSRDMPNITTSSIPFRFSKTGPFHESQPFVSEPLKPVFKKCSRKRKRTCTDSVEIALEEDAPGLFQILVDKGVSMDEIKLYGENENDDTLDDSYIEESFSELEAVISKIFSQRQSFFKFTRIRLAKGEKASYCLACLVSLVEQTRYLRFRKWPAEWGWCRDLRSFIFVFERHNRIVLERPEYGYATYFFEIANSSPIQWQIKRLVIAMKLTNCSRITLIENKALLVGEDLSEGEARVLMEYGWEPNSSLAAMLNYRDRVVHDKRSEVGTEWRFKIGQLLADGYNGGIMISKTDLENTGEQKPEIKPEL